MFCAFFDHSHVCSLQVELLCLVLFIYIFHHKSSGSSLFTNSNWFAFGEDKDREANEQSTGSLASPSPNAEEDVKNADEDYNMTANEDEDLADTATSSPEAEAEPKLDPVGTEKPVEWVEWRESLDASDPSEVLPNGELESESGNNDLDAAESSSPSTNVTVTKDEQTDAALLASLDENLSIGSSVPTQTESENPSSSASSSVDEKLAEVGGDSNKDTADDSKGIEQMSS